MKKKPHKKSSVKKNKKSAYSSGYLPYLLSGFVTLVILLLFLNYYNASHNPNVLGISTLFARGGDDSGGDSHDGGDSHSGNSESGPIHGSDKTEAHTGEARSQQNSIADIPSTHGSDDRKPSPALRNEDSHSEDQNGNSTEDTQNGDDIHIDSATDSSHFTLRHNHVEAETEDQIEHDPTASNSLLLTTPSGQQHILILPDQAVKTVLEKNKLTQVLGEDASSSADLTKIKLTVKNNEPVFEVKGIKSEKFFGLIPVNIQKTANVSATTGEVVSTSESFLGRMLDFLSF